MNISDLHRRVSVVKQPRFLLDKFPSTAAAFSLRRLNTEYNSFCVEVRRSSDNSLQNIGFVNGVLDVDSLLDFVGSGDGFVRTWYDQSGQNRNAFQNTNSRQPKIVNNGNLIYNQNGKISINIIDFATQGFLGLYLPPPYTASTQYLGYFTVYQMQTNGVFPYVIGSDPLDRGLVSLHNTTTRVLRTASVRSTASVANAQAINLNQLYLRHDFANRVRIKTFLNNNVNPDIDIADSNTNFNMPNFTVIGANTSSVVVSDILFSEVIFYNENQEPNQVEIRQEITNYYGI